MALTAEGAASKLIAIDPYLNDFKGDLMLRFDNFVQTFNEIENSEGGWKKFTSSYQDFGLVLHKNLKITCKEWIPGAKEVYLIGDFNNWSHTQTPLTVDKYGVWYCELDPVIANKDKIPAIPTMSKYKLRIVTPDGRELYRLSPWAKYVIQDENTKLYESFFLHEHFINKFTFKYPWLLKTSPKHSRKSLRIYEAHIGIASDEYDVASYTNFKDNVVPHIKKMGYNAIQLMAIMEHAYYASFGYQVTSFFAVSSRFGTPDELKALIDECHKNDILVLLDVVHSHSSRNTLDGLNQFNGTEGCFFHDNARGYHDLWNSRLFDYSQYEVKRFLHSNLRWFLEEYHFDGFRFDGVTSMIYHSHGIAHGFTGNYHEYFGMFVDMESVAYLQCANYWLHKFYPNIITIAEEVSGVPALCRPVRECGFGFDYRLAMAIPDSWIKILKEQKDDDLNINALVHTLVNRRHNEKHVAYAESHDQALVGDKTIAFWLMDQEMYWNMSCSQQKNMVVSRGIALHKMIRLLTSGLGGEAYLNFIGNEFGHPEWLDFPREGNNNSYHYARRQFSLVNNNDLRYRFLANFDSAMNHLEEKYSWLSSPQAYVSTKHEDDKVIVFERANLLWIFNFHPTKSFTDYQVGCDYFGTYEIVLNTDDPQFDGFSNIDPKAKYLSENYAYNNRQYSIKVYIPSRVAIVLRPITKETKN